MRFKRAILLNILLVCLLLTASCGKNKSETAPPRTNSADSLIIELSGQDGKSVLEITTASHSVDYSESSMGAFVNAIDSVYSAGGFWWVFTVNDSAGQIACDRYITDDSDVIKWHFRKP